jgi:hypothetical protein
VLVRTGTGYAKQHSFGDSAGQRPSTTVSTNKSFSVAVYRQMIRAIATRLTSDKIRSERDLHSSLMPASIGHIRFYNDDD